MRRPFSPRNRARVVQALVMLALLAIASAALVAIGLRTRDAGIGLAVLTGAILGWVFRRRRPRDDANEESRSR